MSYFSMRVNINSKPQVRVDYKLFRNITNE